MPKNKLLSTYLRQKKLTALKALLPDLFEKDKLNITSLKRFLGSEYQMEEKNYALHWFGKENALANAKHADKRKRVFDAKKSIHPEHSKNLFIEADNLDAMQALRVDYQEKIKLIYMDPPYNTGRDFGYSDKFQIRSKPYLEYLNNTDIGRVDSNLKNQIESGEIHTNWLNMIYPRLLVGRELLTQDGVLCISIDEMERGNLQLLGSEIFGEENYLGCFIWVNRGIANDCKNRFASTHEYILLFAKDAAKVQFRGEEKDFSPYSNPDQDTQGDWMPDNPTASSGNNNSRFPIINPHTSEEYLPPNGRYWAFSKNRVEEWTNTGKMVFPNEKGKRFLLKKYKSELKSNFKPIASVLANIPTAKGTRELKELYPEGLPFKYPKPTDLLIKILEQLSDDKDVILDCFAGSASMAHAVFELNEREKSTRNFICIQNTEACKSGSDAAIMGFKTISDIAMDRIKRAGILYPNLDTGFRFYSLAENE
ncbi:site-specific DNA-methyltransferase [Ancylomarina longa]|nr:site-specific DNA-methyltransferase [Ancylomarina longa]